MALSAPWIVCAANFYSAHLIVVGPRHFDSTMQSQIAVRALRDQRETQGFIDQHGIFYTRREAWAIAEKNGQIKRRVGGDGPDGHGLFSENLY